MRGIAELAPRSREQARKGDTKARTKPSPIGGNDFSDNQGIPARSHVRINQLAVAHESIVAHECPLNEVNKKSNDLRR